MKILQITTYDIENPDHGGKIRSHYIRKSLRRKYEIETLSFEWRDAEDCSSLCAFLDQARWPMLGIEGVTCDWGIFTYLEKTSEAFATVAQNVRLFAPDVLLVEQPFLWPLAEKFLAQGVVSPSIKVIYSSHNIEVGMKCKIYSDVLSEEKAQQYTTYVDEMERGIIKSCVGALAVSVKDAEYIHELAPDTPVRVFLNGHTGPVATDVDTLWRAKFASRKTNFVFVGSWHPPNINGLKQLVEAMPTNIPSASFALWVLGNVGNGLKAIPGFDVNRYPWLHLMGPVEARDIDAAILHASGVVLPIWEGGGSNLKTAQALLSGKCVLGSEFSFRGFEHCAHEPGVFLANDAVGLACLLTETEPEITYVRSAAVKGLEWDTILEPLPAYFAEILNGSGMEPV